jgi:hypothetical protein
VTAPDASAGRSYAGPVPAAWLTGGMPDGAMAAFSEGACPVHHSPLAVQTISHGGQGSLPYRESGAGWCSQCRAHWHITTYAGRPSLTVTWDTTGSAEFPAGQHLLTGQKHPEQETRS